MHMGLTEVEKNNPAQFLKLKSAITDYTKITCRLFGQQFSMLTDIIPLKYVMTTANHDVTISNKPSCKCSYHFNIKNRPGKTNADSNGLSQLSVENKRTDINIYSASAICNEAVLTPFIECLAIDHQPLTL